MAACETEGAKALLAPAAAGEPGAAALWAAADCAAELCGLLRAALIVDADGAADCAEAWVILWLFCARAWPLCTEALGVVTEGEKELLDPAALAAEEDWAPLAEADCEDALLGLLRAAFILAEDWAAACEAEAEAIGVSRMESRISSLISWTAESSPLREMVNCCSLRPALRLPSMNQSFS